MASVGDFETLSYAVMTGIRSHTGCDASQTAQSSRARHDSRYCILHTLLRRHSLDMQRAAGGCSPFRMCKMRENTKTGSLRVPEIPIAPDAQSGHSRSDLGRTSEGSETSPRGRAEIRVDAAALRMRRAPIRSHVLASADPTFLEISCGFGNVGTSRKSRVVCRVSLLPRRVV